MEQENVSPASTRTQMPTPPPTPLINLPGLGEDDSSGGLPPQVRRRRRRWFIAIIVLVLLALLGGILFQVLRREPAVTYQHGHVAQGNLTLTVNATGPLQSGTYNLIFNGAGGKIDEIDVVVGQKVVKGQVLARLDRTALQDAVDQAQIAVNNAQASLNAALAAAGSSSGQSSANVSAAQTAVAAAKASQSQTQAQGAASIAAAQQAVDNANSNLEQVQLTANAQKQQALDAYNATGCSNAAPTVTTTPVAGTPVASPPATTNCPQAYDTYQLAVQQADASIAAAQAQLKVAQASYNQAVAAANANNTTAANEVSSAESQLTSTQAGAGVSGTSGETQVIAAQDQLNLALGQLRQAQHNLANATLKAPHNGTVTLINGTVGGTPGAGASSTEAAGEFIQLVDLSVLQVQADVNEADIANLQVGETASFTVNAYGNQQFTGTISAIPPTGVTLSNVVTYPVQIDVDADSLKGAHLLPAMTANVTINAVQHKNVLLLPVNAVNFARLASSGNTTSRTPQLISARTAQLAVNRARQLLASLEVAHPDLVAQGPIPAFVIEQSGSQFIAKPVVLGLTDGTSYEILQGISLSDSFIVGTNG